MGEVLAARDSLKAMSVSRLAIGFGMARETVKKRLDAAMVAPSGMRDGHPVYALLDAARAIIGSNKPSAEGELGDPRDYPPDLRKTWYQSEEARLSVEAKTRRLIPAAEVETEFAELVKLLIQFVDTLGDQLERDVGLSPEQVEHTQRVVMKQRLVLFKKLTTDDEPQVETA